MSRRLILIAAATVAMAAAAAAYAVHTTAQSAKFTGSIAPTNVAHHGTASTGYLGGAAAHRVTARTYARAPQPNSRELRRLTAGLNEESAPAPNRVAVNPSSTGPAVVAPNTPTQADADYKAYTAHNLPTSSIVGGPTYSSFTNEPSVAKAGNNALMTGNWYAAYSNDSTASWHFLNPFAIFGSGFCCDQVTLYDKTHDRVYWILQYGDHLAIANAPSTNLTSWCYYNFAPTTIGQASTTSLDFNDAMIGQKNLYLTTNIFPSGGGYGSEIVRLPLEPMSSCSGFGFGYYSQLNSFGWRLAQGSVDRAYWGADWDPTGARANGSNFRVFYWDESSGSIFFYDRAIDPFAFYTRNTGQNCGSADLAVKNWCQYADSRVLGAYRANGVVGFSMNAKQGGAFPYPYTVREYFRESDLAYLGHSNLWAGWSALQFLSLAPNSRGHVGGVFYWGGASSTTHYFPATASLIDDDITPNQPWTVSFWPHSSAGNTCTYSGLYRWGDYSTTRTNDAADTTWIGTGYREIGNCGTAGSYSQPTVETFGRARDMGDINRWASK